MSTLEKLPVTVITGFLGSGKTTLIRHLISFRGLSRKETCTEKLPKLSMSGLARVEQAPSRGLMES